MSIILESCPKFDKQIEDITINQRVALIVLDTVIHVHVNTYEIGL